LDVFLELNIELAIWDHHEEASQGKGPQPGGGIGERIAETIHKKASGFFEGIDP